MAWGLVLAGLWPQTMSNSAWRRSAASGAHLAPTVSETAFSAAAPQIDRSRPLAPIRFQRRRELTPIWTRPRVPLKE
jgi:hypothetical protein